MATALVSGVLWAQEAPAISQPASPEAAGPAHGRLRPARIWRQLNLSEAQKQEAQSIFQQARQNAQPLRQQLRQNLEALNASVKANQNIQALATQRGALMGQMIAVRSEARSQFYQLLTPEQRTQLDQLEQARANHRRQRGSAPQE